MNSENISAIQKAIAHAQKWGIDTRPQERELRVMFERETTGRLKSFDQRELASWLTSLGPEYKKYSRLMEFAGVSGRDLCGMGNRELGEFVTTPAHRARILCFVNKWR